MNYAYVVVAYGGEDDHDSHERTTVIASSLSRKTAEAYADKVRTAIEEIRVITKDIERLVMVWWRDNKNPTMPLMLGPAYTEKQWEAHREWCQAHYYEYSQTVCNERERLHSIAEYTAFQKVVRGFDDSAGFERIEIVEVANLTNEIEE